MGKIKIAHVLHSVGGVDIYLRLIIENIDNERFDNIIIHGINDTNQPFFDKNGEKTPSFKTTIIRNISIIKDLKAIIEVYRIVKKERPDIIHVHSAKGGIIGRIAGRILKIKVIYTPHAFSYLSAENKIKQKLFLLIERFFSKGNVYILATSISEKSRAIDEVGFDLKHAFHVDNAINSIKTIPDLSLPIAIPKNYICTVGRPSYQKNIELMIEVFSKINESRKDIHLVVMGVGHHSDRLSNVKDLIRKKKLNDKVLLIDWTDRANILNIISNSILYISTARYEGMPYSVIESLALSKPCVVSNCDGNKDLIKDGFNGFIIKNEEVQKYVEKTLYLLSDTSILNQFSENAFSSFNKDYNISKNIKKIENFYIEQSEK